MKNMKLFYLFSVITLLLIGIVSAQSTTIVGKVYKASDYNQGVPNADITVVCNDLTNTTITSESGDYAIIFPDSSCKDGNQVSVTAQSGDWKGSENGAIQSCNKDVNCSDSSISYIAVVNPIMTETVKVVKKSSSGGGGSSHTTIVVNNSTSNTMQNGTYQNLQLVNSSTNYSTTGNVNLNITQPDQSNITNNYSSQNLSNEKKDLGAITGAFISTATGSWVLVIVFLGIIILLYLAIRSKK
jgi:hypothetical protein